MKRVRLAISAMAALVVAGCGTTVSGVTAASDGLSPGATSDNSLSVPTLGPGPGGTTSGLATTSVVTGHTGPGLVAGPGSAGSTPGGVTGASGGVGTDSAQGLGVGITATKVYVGVSYTTNGDAANAALGAASLTQGDTKADAQAVIDDINSHGGVAGRKLTPVWYGYDANSQAPHATQDEAACQAFTEDNHVYAVVGTGYTQTFEDCLTQHGVLHVESGPIIDPDKAIFARHPNYFEVGTLSQDRMMADYVTTLQRMNYFTGWNTATGKPSPAIPVKVGIMSVDLPEWNRPLDHVLLPALQRLGHPVNPSDVIRVHNPNSAGEDGQTVNQIESATLKFRQDGVTHVILLDPSGAFLLFQSPVDRGQNWYPRFGINSGSGAQAIYDNGSVTNQQLNGAVGLGWLPTLDLSPGKSGAYQTAATRHCLAVLRRAGQSFSSTNAASLALGYCDQLYLLADAVNHATPTINLQTGIAAIEGLRSSFVPAGLPAAFFSATRHDAAQLGFDLMWNESCACAQYVGRSHVIPG